MMRIFITGASGYIGSVVSEKALKAGHTVVGLARSEASAEKIEKLGATALRGTLQDLDRLAKAASEADAVLHLGFVHEFDKPFEELIAIDIAAIKAMGEAMKSTNKPLVMTTGTGLVQGNNGKETFEDAPLNELGHLRGASEKAAFEFVPKGVRAMAIRLSPFVYGRGSSTFAPVTIEASAKHGFAPYFGDGQQMTSTCDVDAAADLYLLAMEKGKGGEIYNCTTETDVKLKDLADTISGVFKIPVKNVDNEIIDKMVGPFIGRFLKVENRASSRKAEKELGWKPQPKFGLLDDIKHGSYQPLVNKLKGEWSLVK